MNNLDRSVIKGQAKQLMSGKVFKLFLIIFIVSLLAGNTSFLSSGYNNIKDQIKYIVSNQDSTQNNEDNDIASDDDVFDDNTSDNNADEGTTSDNNDQFSDFDEFFNYQQGGGADNPIENFEPALQDEEAFGNRIKDNAESFANSISGEVEDRLERNLSASLFAMGLKIITIVISLLVSLVLYIVFAPLRITLAGVLVGFIRRDPARKLELGKELSKLFKDSFGKNFGRKLGLDIVRSLVIILLSLFLIVPGVIYSYSTRFASQLICDDPELSFRGALKLSRKLTKGNRTELLVLDLSFIPWILLMLVTFGFAGIYVLPYINVTNALYYENFRLRAIHFGAIKEDEIKVADMNNNQGDTENTNYYSQSAYGGNGFTQNACNGNYYEEYSNSNNYYAPKPETENRQDPAPVYTVSDNEITVNPVDVAEGEQESEINQAETANNNEVAIQEEEANEDQGN